MGKNIISSDVVLVTSDEKSKNYKWENNYDKLKAIDVISYDYGWMDNKFDGNHFIGRKLNCDQVFLKSPFESDKYIEINQAEAYFYKIKIKFYKRIAFLLGAKKFSAQAEFVEETRYTLDADGNVSCKYVDIDADYKKKIVTSIKSSYELETGFEPDTSFDRRKGYEDAKKLIQEHNLDNEIDLTSLVENNNPDYQNKETSQIMRFQLTNELNSLIEMSFKINIMGGVFGLGAGFKTQTESVKKIILKTEVNF